MDIKAVTTGAVQPGASSGKPKFGELMKPTAEGPLAGAPKVEAPHRPGSGASGVQAAGRPAHVVELRSKQSVRSPEAVGGARGVGAQQVVSTLNRVGEAQARIERVLALAQSGKTFTPAELLALQAQVYRATQELDLVGKVVEKATSGVKQVLQTQV